MKLQCQPFSWHRSSNPGQSQHKHSGMKEPFYPRYGNYNLNHKCFLKLLLITNNFSCNVPLNVYFIWVENSKTTWKSNCLLDTFIINLGLPLAVLLLSLSLTSVSYCRAWGDSATGQSMGSVHIIQVTMCIPKDEPFQSAVQSITWPMIQEIIRCLNVLFFKM